MRRGQNGYRTAEDQHSDEQKGKSRSSSNSRHHVNLSLMSTIASHHDPSSFEEANKEPSWRDAMQVEYNALRRNCTWELLEPPQGKKAIGFKWVYRTE